MKQVEVMRTETFWMGSEVSDGEKAKSISAMEQQGWAVRQILVDGHGTMWVVFEDNR